jgi:hypothetical protein
MLGGVLLSVVVAAAVPAPLVTATPLDTLSACLRDRLTPSGRVTAINTAAGVMLDFAFDTVGADGRVLPSHLGFTIEDHGTERSLAVTAANPADAALAQQYLRQAGARCATGGDPRASLLHGTP